MQRFIPADPRGFASEACPKSESAGARHPKTTACAACLFCNEGLSSRIGSSWTSGAYGRKRLATSAGGTDLIRSSTTLQTFDPQLNTGRRTLVATWDRELQNRRLRWAAADCMTTLRPHGPQLRNAPANFITRRLSRRSTHSPPATSTVLLLRSATTERIRTQNLFLPGGSRLPSMQSR